MSLPELKICEQIPEKISDSLNNGFDGLVYFEFDVYYTNETLNTKAFKAGTTSYGFTDHTIMPAFIQKIRPLLKNYRSVITTSGFNDPKNLIHTNSGSATTKYAFMPLERTYSNLNLSKPLINDNGLEWLNIIDVYLHEFTHTIEQAEELGLDNFHDYEGYQHYLHPLTTEEAITATIKYLRNDGELYGKQTGIPFEYWTGEIEVNDWWFNLLI